MPLNNNQRTAIRNGINAETDPAIVAARNPATRDDAVLTAWCNGLSNTDAWIAACDSRTMFEAMTITQFDALTAGKRATWDIMMRNAPLDFGRAKLRNAVVDVWGATDSVAVLTALREKATRAEAYIGGNSETTNTVAGLDRGYVGPLSMLDVGQAMNG